MHARRSQLLNVWRLAISRCDARTLTAECFSDLGEATGPVHVFAVGKAAGAMATGALDVLAERAGRIVVVGQTEAGAPPQAEVHVGDHPEPGPASFEAGRAAFDAASGMRAAGEPVLALVSGGGSALCEVPAEGLTEDDLVLAHRVLVHCGAPIETVNRIRARLSAIKGGGLGRALWDALRYEGVLVDVPSGDPDAVASGPFRDGGPAPVDRRVVGDPARLAETAAALGRDTATLGADADLGPVSMRETPISAEPFDAVVSEILEHLEGQGGLWVATGEVPVGLPPEGPGGRGGRAQHLALAVLEAALDRMPAERPWVFLAGGSDGRDGSGAAGAAVDHETAAAITAPGAPFGRDAMRDALARHASGEAHRTLSTLIPEQPPRTNLTDLYLAWSAPRS